MKLQNVCHFIVDCPHSTAPDEGYGIPLIRTPNIGYGRFNLEGVHRVSEKVYQVRCARAIPQNDDIIFAREAPAGNAAIIKNNEKLCLGQRTVLIRPNPEKVYPDYLVYYLLAPEQQYKLLGTANGATVAHVNLPTIREMNVDNLPPIEVQRKIADILSAYDDLIENNRKQIKLLEEAAQRLYKEWFIDLRFPGHETTPIIDDIPEGWELKKLGNWINTFSGGTPSRKNKDFYQAGTNYWVKTQELTDEFIFETEEKITDNAIKCSSAKYINQNSILMAMYGATIGKLGIAATRLTCNQACCVFDLSSQPDIMPYLYLWLKLNRDFFISQGIGSAQSNLSQAMIKNFDIVVPCQEVLSDFSQIATKIFTRILKLQKSVNEAKNARDRLLPKLMNGELEVSYD